RNLGRDRGRDDVGHPARVDQLEIAEIRVERGVSYHGIALNIDPDLSDFGLIDPCGMPDVISTSVAVEAGRPDEQPSTAVVAQAAVVFARAFASGIDVTLEGYGSASPASASPAPRSGVPAMVG
ncbi:MAG: lipoyl(octanoyl) transferase, partial [Chloroflexota bacterium]|nr:lipoyl(octanoyl) transferase [Chloroflexota bacterium]